MSENLERAKQLLGKNTYALVDGDKIACGNMHGLKPLYNLITSGTNYSTYSAADRVVGKAAAMLYVALNVREVHATVTTEGAIRFLRNHGIAFTYDRVVDEIINRKGDDVCPMEKLTANESDPQVALKKIKDFFAEKETK